MRKFKRRNREYNMYFTKKGVRYVSRKRKDERNIKVNNLLTNKKVIEGILSLKSDDMIYCYFVNSSSYYEIVELKTENRTILSLDDYNEIYNRQGTLGIVISPIMFVIMFGIAVKALWHMRKERTTI